MTVTGRPDIVILPRPKFVAGKGRHFGISRSRKRENVFGPVAGSRSGKVRAVRPYGRWIGTGDK
jgi:hypothetical protein